MELTNGELFVVENGLRLAVDELRKSEYKSLVLNTMVARNLKNVSETCHGFRQEINEFMPKELRELNETEGELSEENLSRKNELQAEYNKEINKFLETKTNFDFFTVKVPLESLSKIELGYDASNILQLILLGE
jgi:hypothetical protein